jgi:hypothetical protein
VGRGDIPPLIHVGLHTSNDASIRSKVKVKVKSKDKSNFTVELATKSQKVEEIQLYFFLNSALDGVGGQRHALAALPPGKRPV